VVGDHLCQLGVGHDAADGIHQRLVEQLQAASHGVDQECLLFVFNTITTAMHRYVAVQAAVSLSNNGSHY
jgi:hypothetical protein